MGVMQCDRKGCESVLCDLYSATYGYICYDCMNELRAKVPDVSVEQFMKSNKESEDVCRKLMKDAALQFINSEFQLLGE